MGVQIDSECWVAEILITQTLCRDHPDDTECVTLSHGPVLQLQVTVGNFIKAVSLESDIAVSVLRAQAQRVARSWRARQNPSQVGLIFATSRTLLHGCVEAARAAAHVAQEEVAAHLGQVQETQEAGGQQPGGPWRQHGSLITRENGGQSLSSAAYHH